MGILAGKRILVILGRCILESVRATHQSYDQSVFWNWDGPIRHPNLPTVQIYLGKVPDTEVMRWIENLYA